MVPFGNRLGKTLRNVVGFPYQRLSDAPNSNMTIELTGRDEPPKEISLEHEINAIRVPAE